MKGDPDPQVTWTKDGAPISSSEIMEVKYKNGTASVLINEVFPEDAGTSEDKIKRLVYSVSYGVLCVFLNALIIVPSRKLLR